ncbi:MAG: hypothetical protein E6H09_02735 [Bacteroidetes bacterium]|nr:MAG: hypothetical protein E6H09_02735 [Bacteroidota bacterium]
MKSRPSTLASASTFILTLALTLLISTSSFSQNISISSTAASPDPSAMLDIQSTSKGLLVPRMSQAQRIGINNPATGLLVYQVDTDSGFYYNGGSKALPKWISLQNQSGGWSTRGNAGTDTTINFIGTTDVVPLVFKQNNVRAGLLDSIRAETALGYRAMGSTTSGSHNSAFGYKSLELNTTGFNNVAIGSNSMRFNTTGNDNTAAGFLSLRANTTGIDNVAFGSNALLSNTTGSYNHASGYGALNQNTTGAFNTAVGNIALLNNTIGSSNSALGSDALRYNISGNNNVGMGYTALYFNNTGNSNTGIGVGALFNNNSGYSNVAIGMNALFNTGNRSNLVAVGDSALYNNGVGVTQGTQATYNTALGSKSLYANNIGSYNTGLGNGALTSNTNGNWNTAAGVSAMAYNTTGASNTAFGGSALLSNSTGSFNTAIGYNSGTLGDGISYSTAVGALATVGCNNCLVLGHSQAKVGIATSYPAAARLDVAGANAWDLVNSEGDVRIGDANYRLKIGVALGGGGAGAVGLMQYGTNGGYNVMMLGSQGTGILYLNGNTGRVGIGTDNPTQKLSVNGNICYTGSIGACSDIRYKTNLHRIENPLQKILSLNGFYYNWDRKKFPDMEFSDDRQLGFSAQEVEKLFPEIVQTNDKGYKSVDYGRLTPVLVEAVKEQQEEIDALKEIVMDLQKQVKKLRNKN